MEGVGEIPENALLVKADVVGLYPSISHKAGLSALKEALSRKCLENPNRKFS